MRTSSLRRPALRPLAGLAALVVAAACGGGTTETRVPPLARLAINQSGLDTLSELGTRQLTVAGFDADGRPATVPDLVWQSSDAEIATVGAAGELAARRPGTATITARSGGVTTSLALRILPVPIASIAVRLVGGVAADTLLVGGTATLAAEPRDAAARALAGRQVTLSVAEGNATIDGAGRLTAPTVGAVVLTARVDTVERQARLVVRPPFAAGLTARLADPRGLRDTLWIGLGDSVVVAFADSAGAALPTSPFRPVSYTSSDPSIAGVDAEGRISPLRAGTVTLRASGDRLVAARQVAVVHAPITTVLAAPDTVRILPGESTQIRPLLLDGAGLRVSALGTRSLRFESLSPAVATVDAQGNVRGVATGTALLRVTGERAAGTVPVRVVAPAGDRDFRIDVRFIGPPPAPDVAAAFAQAVTRWQNVVRETIGTTRVTLDADWCGNPQALVDESIRDVVIYAEIDSIDGPGQVLGQAGPCLRQQSGRRLPVIGYMGFDSADVRNMATSGRLLNVVTHEIGHVLGVGTLWGGFRTGTSFDPRYTGAGGMLASAGMGFTALSLGTAGDAVLERVPLENTGGPGTAGSHWRRSVFGNELMNGFAGAGASPLSLLTVQAMVDLGYVVSTGSAEPWGQFLFGPGVAASLGRLLDPTGTAGATQIGERLLEPQFEVDAAGRTRRIPGARGVPARRQ